MNSKGFTLVELLATVVLLAIIMGIVLVSTTGGFKKTKEDTEKLFIDTIEDAMDIYLDSDAKNLSYKYEGCTIDKTHKIGVKLYKAYKFSDEGEKINITFNDVINSTYHPLTESDLVNPANDKKCNATATISIYRDEDFVYYYKIDKSEFKYDEENKCLTSSGFISNLPDSVRCTE